MAVKSLLFVLATALATSIPARRETLQPWQLTDLYIVAPVSPGDDWHMDAIIHDPNSIESEGQSGGQKIIFPPSRAICSTEWAVGTDPTYDTPIPCSPIEHGQWSMILRNGTLRAKEGYNPEQDLIVSFALLDAADLTRPGRNSKRFIGGDEFVVGRNLNPIPNPSGFASMELKDKSKPYLIHQREE